MKQRRKILGVLLTLVTLVWTNPLAANASQPIFMVLESSEPQFWKKKKIQNEMIIDREIVVSVTDTESENVKETGKKKEALVLKQLHIKGAGVANVPLEEAQKIVVQYEKLKKLSPDHFEKVKFDPPKKELYVHGKALKWHAKMWMQIHEVWVKEESKKFQIFFEVKKGSFRGMVGRVQLESVAADSSEKFFKRKDHQRRKTEISMTAFYESEKLPLPAILLRFGLEMVMKVVAGRMRDHIETEYQAKSLSQVQNLNVQ